MKHLIAAALCASLAGCATMQPEAALAPVAQGPSPEEIREDNHCRELLMQPGTFVYIQCRLAMDGTQMRHERQFRARLEAVGGQLSPDVENAMRADVICNFNESAKLSQSPGDPQALGYEALGKCRRQRAVLERAVAGWAPGRYDALASYEADTVAANAATILDARTYPAAPPPGSPAAAAAAAEIARRNAAGAPAGGTLPSTGPAPVPAAQTGQLAPMRGY